MAAAGGMLANGRVGKASKARASCWSINLAYARCAPVRVCVPPGAVKRDAGYEWG